jgi:hypothetical protein
LLRPRDLASPTLSLFAGASTLLWAVGFFFAFLAGPLLF